MPINVIERAIVPYNSPDQTLFAKNQYSLFAPIADVNKVGMAGYDPTYFTVPNGVVTFSSALVAKIPFMNDDLFGERVVALGKDSIAGLRAYYFTGINPVEKKIYLSSITSITPWDERNLEPRCGTNVTDSFKLNDFVAPNWYKDDVLGIINLRHHVYRIKVVSVDKNVITYEGDLGFTSIPEDSPDSWSTGDTNYTVFNLTRPGEGAFDIGCAAMAFGQDVIAAGTGVVAVGRGTQAYTYGFASGRNTIASYAAHAEGHHSKAYGNASHAENHETLSSGYASHAEGNTTVSSGESSHAEGMRGVAEGIGSHAEGIDTRATYTGSHAEGNGTVASGEASHTEGFSTNADGLASHAEGYQSNASGDSAHTEGNNTVASSSCAHAEGFKTTASGYASHAEGNASKATGEYSHAEGSASEASGDKSHTEGNGTTAKGDSSHAEGNGTVASGYTAHAEGCETNASYQFAHAEGHKTTASSQATHAEGFNTSASGWISHAEGNGTTSSGHASHAEGRDTTASNEQSHAEGYGTTASGGYAHAEGWNTTAEQRATHVEGCETKALYQFAHAEGYQTTASSQAAHAEGFSTTASGWISHAEGNTTTASGTHAHSEGQNTIASGHCAHAEGQNTQALGEYSHAGGHYTIASKSHQTAIGCMNATDPDAMFMIGNGNVETGVRSNAFVVRRDGSMLLNDVVVTSDELKRMRDSLIFGRYKVTVQKDVMVDMSDYRYKRILVLPMVFLPRLSPTTTDVGELEFINLGFTEKTMSSDIWLEGVYENEPDYCGFMPVYTTERAPVLDAYGKLEIGAVYRVRGPVFYKVNHVRANPYFNVDIYSVEEV